MNFCASPDSPSAQRFGKPTLLPVARGDRFPWRAGERVDGPARKPQPAPHPLDRPKLRKLGEALCDISAGRLSTRDTLLPMTETLMVCLRDDCSAAGAEGAVDRLLAVADDRLGADAMAEAAAEIIVEAQ
jgi:hypothetical protein